MVLITGRTMVLGEDDVPAGLKLQTQCDLTSLGRWGKGPGGGPPRRNVYDPGDPATDVLAPFKTLNAMLGENPPPAHHAVLLKQFARVGIGPGLDMEAQPEIVRRELVRAAAVGLSPGDERLAIWLPTSGGHPWSAVLRLDRPHAEIVDATWRCPGLKRVGRVQASARGTP